MKRAALLTAILVPALAHSQPAPPAAAPVAKEPAPSLEKLSVTIRGALEDAVRKSASREVAPALSQVMARQMIWWLDVTKDLERGDTVDALWQKVPGKEPLLHALRFVSAKKGREFRAYLFKPEGARFARYWDETGTEVEARLEGSPIEDYEQVTSLLNDGRRHRGVDFKAPIGTSVKMPFDATLSRRNWTTRGNGNCLEFHDAKGRRALFLHLAEARKDLVIGKLYKAGEVVAQSGNTGHTTAPHLHYQLETPDGLLLDPFKEHKTWRKKLEPQALAAFTRARTDYDRQLGIVPAAASAPAALLPTAPEESPGSAASAIPGSGTPAAAAP